MDHMVDDKLYAHGHDGLMDNDGQLPAAVLRGIVAHIDHSPWTAAARYILATVNIQSCSCPHAHKPGYYTRGVFTGPFYSLSLFHHSIYKLFFYLILYP